MQTNVSGGHGGRYRDDDSDDDEEVEEKSLTTQVKVRFFSYNFLKYFCQIFY